MKNIITIIKKELKRFFTDKRMVMTLVFPGLLIYVMYSFMGTLLYNIDTVDKDYVASVYHVGDIPDEVIQTIGQVPDFKYQTYEIEETEISAIKDKIVVGDADILMVFPENFDITTVNDMGMNVEIYFNSVKAPSKNAYDIFSAVIELYRTHTTHLFDLNGNKDVKYDMATEKDISGMIFASMLPLLIIMFLFSGCMAVTPESISGEKERGTIATLLVTPMKRSELAIGKIISLSIVALVSAVSSTIGTILSLPKLMALSDSVSLNYGVMDYLAIFLVVISMVLVIVSLMAIISTFAKSVKEANTLSMPVMILSTLIGLSSMLFTTPPTNPFIYCIPLFSGVQALSAILSFNLNWLHIFISLGSSIIITAGLVFILIKMFNNEKIIFNK